MFLLPLSVHDSSDHRILQAPVNASAPLDSNATFYCAVTQAEISWRLNGRNILLDDEHAWSIAEQDGLFRGEMFSNSTVNTSVLIIAASRENNRTFSIACSAFGGLSHLPRNSPNVFLTVFGQLLHTQYAVSPIALGFFLETLTIK